MADESLQGEVLRIVYRHESTDWSVLRIRVSGMRGEQTLVGVTVAQAGQFVTAAGRWGMRDGQRQFEAQRITASNPTTPEGVCAYLGSGMIPGVGAKKAEKMVAHFGTSLLTVLDAEPERLKEIRGFGPATIAKIAKGWQEHKAVSEVMLFLHSHDISPALCRRIYRAYGDKTIETIRANPYALSVDVRGVGFKTADSIAKSLSIPANSPQRILAGLVFLMNEDMTKGHCGKRRPDLLRVAVEALGVDAQQIANVLDTDLRGESAHKQQFVQHADIVCLQWLSRSEEEIARIMQERAALPSRWADKATPELIDRVAEKSGMTLADKQRRAVEMALKSRVAVITGGPGVGKAQPIDAQVLTPSGFKAIGDLRVGDPVVAADGAVSRITGVFPQGVKDIYRVRFEDGRQTRCCGEHLWKVWTRTSEWSPERKQKVRSRGWRVLPLDTIRDRKQRQATEHQRIAVPLFAPPEDADRPLPVDPYFMGALLGDGSFSNMTLTKKDAVLLEKVATIARQSGLTVLFRNPPSRCAYIRFSGGGLRKYLREQGLLACRSHEKFIPDTFLQASARQRRQLLQGLLDTDGHVGNNRAVSFTSSSEVMARQVQRLAWSLGGKATIAAKATRYRATSGDVRAGRTAYTVCISHDQAANLLWLPRKRSRLDGRRTIHRRLLIDSIEPNGQAPCVCISVDHPDQLYVTDDYIVTHNTSTLNVVLAAMRELKLRISLAAPTGKAAQRAAEATGMPASTIHRLLGIKGADSRPGEIDADVTVVDEFSMVDVPLMRHLVRSWKQGTTLLMVGDVDQLPSVGPGQVLGDVIRSGAVPVTVLDEVFRQAQGSLIIRNAHAINRGEMPECGGRNDDFFILDERNTDEIRLAMDGEDDKIPAQIAQATAAIIEGLVAKRLPQGYGVDPVRDIQVLCPMNKGAAGVGEMNQRLQRALNPRPAHAVTRFGTRFGVGDKVIQTRNNYDLEIFNGDMGIVESVDDEESTLHVRFDGRGVGIPFDDLDNLQLAYALTIHKSQGSQFPIVIIPAVTQHWAMLQRNLIYTGVTRARRLVVVVGQRRAIAAAARTVTAARRITRLRDLLKAAPAESPEDLFLAEEAF